MNKFVSVLLFGSILLGCFYSCAKEGNESIEDNSSVSPNDIVPDPEGTITLSMRNSANGNTFINNQIHISSSDNFVGGKIVSVGSVRGLGNITSIPKTGWAEEVSVRPGYGYVIYSDNIFYRVYVESYILAAGTEGVIGAEVRYQYPFYGANEAVKIDKDNIVLPNDGLICITNETVIPIKDFDFSGVENIYNVGEYDVLNGRISLHRCDAPYSVEDITGTILLRNYYGKETFVNLTELGCEASARFSASRISVSPSAVSEYHISELIGRFDDNITFSHLSIKSDADWCDVYLSGRNVYATIKKNNGNSQREANIDLLYKGQVIHNLSLTQEAPYFRVPKSILYYGKTASSYTVTLETNLADNDIAIESSQSWCTYTLSGKDLTIRVSATSIDRKAEIFFSDINHKIIIDQSRYGIGDSYVIENYSSTATVAYIGEDVRYYSLLIDDSGNQVVWSTERTFLGATDMDDGMKNLETIRQKLSSNDIQEFYPAFKYCEIVPEEGWYVPSYNESVLIASDKLRSINQLVNYSFWTSTEIDAGNAYRKDNYYERYASSQKDVKPFNTIICLIKKF